MSVEHIDAILNDCLLAAGQGIGTEKSVDFDVVVWWRTRYRRFFLHAITAKGNDYAADRRRVGTTPAIRPRSTCAPPSWHRATWRPAAR